MKRIRDIKFLLSRLWEASKTYILFSVLQNIFSAFLPLINIIGLGMVVHSLVTGEPHSRVVILIIICISINLGVKIIQELFNMFENKIMRVLSNIMQFGFSRDSVHVNYHYAQDGTVLNLRRKSMVAYPPYYMLGMFLNHIIQFAAIISIFSVLSPLFILVLGVTSAISVVLTFKAQKNDFDFENDKVEEDRKIDYLYQVMTGYEFAKEIRINNAEDYVANKYMNILQTQIHKLKMLYKKSMRINIASTVITIVQTVAMYLFFSYQVYSGQITIAEYTVLLSTTTLLTGLLLWFFENIARIDRLCKAIVFYHEYHDLIDKHSDITQSNKFEERDIDFSNAVIKFENVSFAYPNTDKMILKNINFEIRKGEKIGIVGLNGSGKTTFTKLLTRIYDPTDGKITINGVDIKEIPYRQYISHIGVVLQDFLLFAYSVKENIVLDSDYDEAKFMSSIEKSGLKAKIDSLKNGIETSIYKTLDDDGVEFSGGEGQKLALARAIYKNAEMLILDEPTSALDPIAEYELFSKLNDIAENKAAIFISHRLSSTKFCDRITVLSDGEIVECGHHDELMRKRGFYAELFNAQAQYYREKGVEIIEEYEK